MPKTERKMQIFIISILYAIIAAVLSLFAVKNFLKMKHSGDQLYRQYFFTLLFLLFVLLASFVTILLRVKAEVFIDSGDGRISFTGLHIKSGLRGILSIILIILGIGVVVLFDRYFLKRKSKTEREYRIRRRLVAGILAVLIGAIAVLKAMGNL